MKTKRLKIINCYATLQSECTHKTHGLYNIWLAEFADTNSCVESGIENAIKFNTGKLIIHHNHYGWDNE